MTVGIWQSAWGNLETKYWREVISDGVQLRRKAQVKWVNLMAGHQKPKENMAELMAKPITKNITKPTDVTIKSFVCEEEYLEVNSEGNRKPVQSS